MFSGYQLAFRQTAGFSALGLPITPAFPVKVVRGPTQSIWVIDEGDFLSTSIAAPRCWTRTCAGALTCAAIA